MTNYIVPFYSHEEQELEEKTSELLSLETKLADKELILATLIAELHYFENQYSRLIDIKYDELNKLKIQVAQYESHILNKQSIGFFTDDTTVSYTFDSSLREIPLEEFKPSERLKKLYRQVAKQIHPDLATNEEERETRKNIMIQVNKAYESGDEELLFALLNDCHKNIEELDYQINIKLILTTNKITQTKIRIGAIDEEVNSIITSHLYQLKIKVTLAQEVGKDLLAEMATKIDQEISVLRLRMEELHNYFQDKPTIMD